MDPTRAIEIVTALADGHNPYTGEVFEQESVFQNPDTARALHLALDALRIRLRNTERKRVQPENAGKPWTEEEVAKLISEFEQGIDIQAMAKEHQRTNWAIRERLIQLGKTQY